MVSIKTLQFREATAPKDKGHITLPKITWHELNTALLK